MTALVLLLAAILDAGTAAHVKEVAARGARAGLRPNAFAKIGDSVYENLRFLQQLGGDYDDRLAWGEHKRLEETLRWFRGAPVRGGEGKNSFDRVSLATRGGWHAAQALGRLPVELGARELERLATRSPATPAQIQKSPMAAEIEATRPAIVFVLFGANEIWNGVPVDVFARDLEQIVDYLEQRGVVAVLATIPVFPTCSDTDGKHKAAPRFNAAVQELARKRKLPVMDLHAALDRLPDHGLNVGQAKLGKCKDAKYAGTDHPSYCGQSDTDPEHEAIVTQDFTKKCLQYGYNVMNLKALEMLDALRPLIAGPAAGKK